MKRDEELNPIDKFLYKFLFCLILLLAVVLLGKVKLIEFDSFQNALSEHVNFIPILKAVNGEEGVLLPIEFSDQVAVTNLKAYRESLRYESGKRKVVLDEFTGVEAYKTGVVVKIMKNKDKTFCLTVKGIDGYEYVYDQLSEVNVNIYKVVASGEIIASPKTDSEETYFIFGVYEKGTIKEILP